MAIARSRVLLVPNEREGYPQRSSRLGLARLAKVGAISSADVYSHQLRVLREGAGSAIDGLIGRIASFRPDILVFQHPGESGLNAAEMRRVRDAHDFCLVYYEGDPYGRFMHRLPPAARAVAKESDVVLTAGSGQFARNFSRAGARDVRWSPSRYDPDSFGRAPIELARPYDFVMIANKSRPRLPFRALPGARQRVELVELMQRRFGERFAIYGEGWRGPSAKGKIPFWEQEAAIASGWISVNWDHYPKEKSYFSNRLPISLAAGSIHVTGRHPGYSEFFGSGLPFLHFSDSPRELVGLAGEVLERMNHDERISAIRHGRRWVSDHLRADDQITDVLNAGGAGISSQERTQARLVAVEALDAV